MKKVKLLLITSLMTLGAFSPAYSQPDAKSDSETENIKSPQEYTWYDFRRGLFVANQQSKPVLINFCNDHDLYCQKLREQTYSDSEVKKYLSEHFVLINVDSDSRTALKIGDDLKKEKDLLGNYNVIGYPTMIFADSAGKPLTGSVRGFIPPDKLLPILEYIGSDAYKTTKFSVFSKRRRYK